MYSKLRRRDKYWRRGLLFSPPECQCTMLENGAGPTQQRGHGEPTLVRMHVDCCCREVGLHTDKLAVGTAVVASFLALSLTSWLYGDMVTFVTLCYVRCVASREGPVGDC